MASLAMSVHTKTIRLSFLGFSLQVKESGQVDDDRIRDLLKRTCRRRLSMVSYDYRQ